MTIVRVGGNWHCVRVRSHRHAADASAARAAVRSTGGTGGIDLLISQFAAATAALLLEFVGRPPAVGRRGRVRFAVLRYGWLVVPPSEAAAGCSALCE
jgi:hypothetical protein